MTVALILAGQADAGLRGQLTALGVRRVDATDRAGPALLSVAAAAQVAGERVLICAGDGTVPEEILARLLRAGGTAAFTRTGAGALVVDTPDLGALAGAGPGTRGARRHRRAHRGARTARRQGPRAGCRAGRRRRGRPAGRRNHRRRDGQMAGPSPANPGRALRDRPGPRAALRGVVRRSVDPGPGGRRRRAARLADDRPGPRCWPPASTAHQRAQRHQRATTTAPPARQAASAGPTPPSTGSGPPRACCPNSRSTPPWPSLPARQALPPVWRGWTASTARTSGTP